MPVDDNWHERELLKDLAASIVSRKIEIIRNVDPLASRLAECYPLQSGRIDWRLVDNVRELAATPESTVSDFQLAEPATALRHFWQEVRRENSIDDDTTAIVFGDSLISFLLRLSIDTLTCHLVEILSIPHHTYIFPEDVSWCFNYTMEGNAFFARRPVRRSDWPQFK